MDKAPIFDLSSVVGSMNNFDKIDNVVSHNVDKIGLGNAARIAEACSDKDIEAVRTALICIDLPTNLKKHLLLLCK